MESKLDNEKQNHVTTEKEKNALRKQLVAVTSELDARIKEIDSMVDVNTLPPELASRVVQARAAVRRTRGRNSFQQIGIALRNYHDVFNSYPVFARGPNGDELYSWRVSLLPFLDQANLFKNTIRLDKSWDAPENEQARRRAPAVFQCGGARQDGYTNMVAVNYDGALFQPKRGDAFDVLDNTSARIIGIEVPESKINWMQPKDFAVDEAVHAILNRSSSDPGTLVLMDDGSVKSIFKTIAENVLRQYFAKVKEPGRSDF